MKSPFFTVFTPTYNRAHTLERVYRSLLSQTDRDFEWIIVDDGSTDGTNALVTGWIEQSTLSIRYFQQANGGKHTAINLGVSKASGEMFLIFDSDDYCEPFTLERFRYHWLLIPECNRHKYGGIISLCRYEDGSIIGTPFPKQPIDGPLYEVFDRYKLTGDKWILMRTAVLESFPFPVFAGETFIAEGVVWNRISRNFIFRYINEPLLCVRYFHDGLSASSLSNRLLSPKGTLLYYKESIYLPVSFSRRLKSAANFFRFGYHSHSFMACITQVGISVTSLLGMLVGGVTYLQDKAREKDGAL